MIRNKHLKFEVDTLRNEKSYSKNTIFLRKILSSTEDKSENIGARVITLIT
jgi:hypothetical protein